MFAVTDQQIYDWIAQYFYPFCRIAAFFAFLPILSTQLVPQRIRLVLALAVTFLLAPVLAPMPVLELLSLPSFLVISQQIIVGMAMAFVVQILFQIFVIGGQAVAMQNGLGFATLVDPVNGVNVASISQAYLMTVNLLFFAFNGHLAVFRLLAESFHALPVSSTGIPVEHYFELAMQGSWMFTGALMVALPSTISLLVVNLTFGVIARAAPQMNIIAIGFPFTMVMGLVIIWLTLTNILPLYENYSAEAFAFMGGMVR